MVVVVVCAEIAAVCFVKVVDRALVGEGFGGVIVETFDRFSSNGDWEVLEAGGLFSEGRSGDLLRSESGRALGEVGLDDIVVDGND